MKKVFISMLALAALASCSSEEVLNEEVDNGQRVPITLKAGMVQVETKAAVEADADGHPTTQMENVVFYKSENTHSGGMDWANATSHPATIATTGAVTFTDPIYYPTDENKYAFLAGVYPSSIGTLDKANKSFTITTFDGQQDIMYANIINGNKKNQTALPVSFAHKLSQLKFTLKKGNGFDVTKTVTKITVNGTCKPTKMNLTNGALEYEATASSLILTSDGGSTVSEAGAPFSQTALIGKVQTGSSITLDIELSDGITIEGVIVNDISDPAISTSYNIDLTFQQKAISAEATIGKWEIGTNGTGTVE